jgi:hypothetical protein
VKTPVVLLVAALGLCQLSFSAGAQEHHKTKYRSEISKLKHARKTDHAVRQVTVDPKKSPGKHADNASKTINHELNRESKDFNHFFQGKSKHKSKKTVTKPR